jgi:hypothetical protein
VEKSYTVHEKNGVLEYRSVGVLEKREWKDGMMKNQRSEIRGHKSEKAKEIVTPVE